MLCVIPAYFWQDREAAAIMIAWEPKSKSKYNSWILAKNVRDERLK